MPLQIVRNDITLMDCDAIVNPSNTELVGTGGTDAAIHLAAGPKLDAACRALGGCAVGQAKRTPGFALPCRHVFHTVGPAWVDGQQGEAEELASCYRACLALAARYHCKSIAFPIISAGTYGFPKALALQIAMREISGYLLSYDLLVYLVVYDSQIFRIGSRLFSDIRQYIDDNYVDAHRPIANYGNVPPPLPSMSMPAGAGPKPRRPRKVSKPVAPPSEAFEFDEQPMLSYSVQAPLEDYLNELDESFSQMLLRKIDERGIKDSDCYKRANVDRKLFSKIRKDVHYRPKKTTAIAFAIALELSLEETNELLRKAGFALSHSNKFDLIIEYFIRNQSYDIFEINETLYAFDQVLLG